MSNLTEDEKRHLREFLATYNDVSRAWRMLRWCGRALKRMILLGAAIAAIWEAFHFGRHTP